MPEFIDKLLREAEQAEEIKKPWLPLFQSCADYFAPSMSDFLIERTQGQRRDEKIIDSHGVEASGRFARSLNAVLTPEGFPWMDLRVSDEELNKVENVRQYLEMLTKYLLAWFHSPGSGFYAMAEEMYSQQGNFGNGPVFIGERNGMPYYRSIFLGEISVLTDADGTVLSAFRCYKQTAFQIVAEFGEEGLPHTIAQAYEKNTQDKFEIVHAVTPRRDGHPFSLAGHPFLSVYILKDERKALRPPGGYFENPYLNPRWDHVPGENYGRGPAMDALGDAKSLQKVVRDTIRGLHKSVDPNIILENDGTVQPRINMNPGGFIYADWTHNGIPKIKTLPFQGNVSHGTAYAAELRDKIDRHFFKDAFELPPFVTPDGAKNHMSATEFAGRQRQQLQFSGPLLTRSRLEFLYPLIRRSIRILLRGKIIPPPPPELVNAEVLPEYVSPLATALGGHKADDIMQFMGHILPLAQVDQRVLLRINPQRTVDALADADHVPRKILNTDEEFSALIDQMAQRDAEEREAANLKDVSQASAQNAKALALTSRI